MILTAEANYATHRPRYSDSSLYDEVCQDCGAKDYAIGADELSARPCLKSPRVGSTYMTDSTTWPISRCRGEHLDTWEFVEEFQGSYDDAMRRAGELQGDQDAEWQYRIWDCREPEMVGNEAT